MNIHPELCCKNGYVTNVTDKEQQIQQNGVDLRINKTVIIQSGSFVNVDFIESIHCIDNVWAPAVYTRSSFSRKGVFCTSGVWDTGYDGPGGCSIYNFSGTNITIEKGTRVCQIIFFNAPHNTNHYDGHYNKTNQIDSKL